MPPLSDSFPHASDMRRLRLRGLVGLDELPSLIVRLLKCNFPNRDQRCLFMLFIDDLLDGRVSFSRHSGQVSCFALRLSSIRVSVHLRMHSSWKMCVHGCVTTQVGEVSKLSQIAHVSVAVTRVMLWVVS